MANNKNKEDEVDLFSYRGALKVDEFLDPNLNLSSEGEDNNNNPSGGDSPNPIDTILPRNKRKLPPLLHNARRSQPGNKRHKTLPLRNEASLFTANSDKKENRSHNIVGSILLTSSSDEDDDIAIVSDNPTIHPPNHNIYDSYRYNDPGISICQENNSLAPAYVNSVQQLRLLKQKQLYLASQLNDVEDNSNYLETTENMTAPKQQDSNIVLLHILFTNSSLSALRGSNDELPLKFRLRKTDPFSKLINVLSSLKKVDEKSIVLKFDGIAIQPDKTPAYFDMEDGDMLTASIQSDLDIEKNSSNKQKKKR